MNGKHCAKKKCIKFVIFQRLAISRPVIACHSRYVTRASSGDTEFWKGKPCVTLGMMSPGEDVECSQHIRSGYSTPMQST